MSNQVRIQWDRIQNSRRPEQGTQLSIVLLSRILDELPGGADSRPKYSLELPSCFHWIDSPVLLVCLCFYLVKYQEGTQRCLAVLSWECEYPDG